MKKLIAVIVGFGIIATAVTMNLDVFSVPTKASGSFETPKSQTRNSETQPEFIPYMFLFQHLSNIQGRQWQVDELKEKSGLSDEQFGKVMGAANGYAEEVAEYDSIAKGIIDEFHKNFPPGRLPEGVGPGDPPQELIDLQAKRDDAAIRYREQLKTELGDDYGKFENLVDIEVRSKMSKGKTEPLYKEGR